MDFVCLRRQLKERNRLRFLFSLVRGAVTNLTVSEGLRTFRTHVFKGGKKYDTPKKVSETIDSIGGDFNAFTGKEYAGYYVKCSGILLKQRLMFSDMLISTKLVAEDIERERGVFSKN